MSTDNSLVQFITCSKLEYMSLEVKDDNALYFITDSHQIYKGTECYATGSTTNGGLQ